MGIIVGIIVIFIVLAVIGAIADSGKGLEGIIIMMIGGGIGCGIGSWLGGDGWAVFGAILGGLMGIAVIKGH